MKLRLLFYILLLFGFGSCNLTEGFQTHELINENMQRWPDSAASAALMDLRGDGREILVTTHFKDNHGFVLLANQNGKSISQINVTDYLPRTPVLLKDPTDGANWLFFTMNDDETLRLIGAKYTWQVPLKREMKSFEDYKRNDDLMDLKVFKWNPLMVPEMLEDIDGDGKQELVCRAVDGYSSNPRGLMVYDWESGKQKWFFRSPSSFNRLYCEDLDRDGEKEFILSNEAFNNNQVDINGITDFGGYLVVINARGELKNVHKVFDGLGTLIVNVADVDQDDVPDIFAVAATRGENTDSDIILRLSYKNNRFYRQKELLVPKSLTQKGGVDFLQRMDSSSSYRLLISDSRRGIVCYDTDLNELPGKVDSDVRRIMDIKDLRRNGKKEVLALNNDNELIILDHKLKELTRINLPLQNRRIFGTKIIENSAGDYPLVAVIMDNTLVTYRLQAIPLSSFIIRLIRTKALWLCLLLMIVALYLFYRLRISTHTGINLLNRMAEALIQVKKDGKITFANKTAVALSIEHNPNSNLKRVQEIFPQIWEAIVQMRKARLQDEETELEICGKSMKVFIYQNPGSGGQYTIILFPRSEQIESETLHWAEIARRLSHHVRRHITNVILALDPLEKTAPPEAEEYVEIIKSEIEKVRVFTHAFQRFTEMHDYHLKLQDVIPSVEHAINGIKLPPGVKVIRNYGLKSIHARIEPIRFEEAIVNTINNATEAMPQGGTLHLSVREFPRHKSPRGNLSVLVEIEDTGKGIPAKYMEDIWQPFFTTNQSGTGIGIPETRKIIDSMGGTMDIQSEEKVGTTVSFWLKGEHDE